MAGRIAASRGQRGGTPTPKRKKPPKTKYKRVKRQIGASSRRTGGV